MCFGAYEKLLKHANAGKSIERLERVYGKFEEETG